MIQLRNVRNIHNLNSNIALCSTKAQPPVPPPALTDKQPTSTSKLKDEWNPFYKNPFISQIASVNRIKTYQMIVTGLVVPITTALQLNSAIPNGMAGTCATIGITGCITFSLLGLVSRNLIGFMYTDKSEQMLRISYIDFWGNRKNEEYMIEEVQHLCETASKLSFYSPVRFYESKDTYKLLHKQGVIDLDRFKKVFGESALK